jgi:hypothetical protein
MVIGNLMWALVYQTIVFNDILNEQGKEKICCSFKKIKYIVSS